MHRPISRLRALLNGLACLAILGLAAFGIQRVAARRWLVQETFSVGAEFASVGGIEPGGRVFVQGIDAGAVEAVEPPTRPGRPVALRLRLDARLRPLIRSDAVARIASQGVVGAKVVEITPGAPDAPPLAVGGTLATEEPVEMAALLDQARESLRRVDRVASSAEAGLADVNAIVGTIRRGEGTLGQLVADDEAYRRFLRLTADGEQALGQLNDNLDAVKHTWPISSYFDRRGYDDRDLALYRPSHRRDSRALAATDLFEPGRSVLTLPGRRALDELARWLDPRLEGESEIVVAAFGDEPAAGDLADILTQEQAEAVRRYLVEEHRLDSAGWFKSRKVAAIGFGAASPRTAPAPDLDLANLPARRVEVIVFTPSA